MARPSPHPLPFVCLTLLAASACSGPERETGDPAPGVSADGPPALPSEAGYGDLGTVRFDTGCEPAAQEHAERALALLHHMTYVDAGGAFTAATEADPGCTMGYWGQAMAIIHPLWPDVPGTEDLERGQAIVARARARTAPEGRPAAYLATVEAYYRDATSRTERERLLAFEAAWADAVEAYPDDLEARSLYALAQLATAEATDKTYAKQTAAMALLDDVMAEVPNHPGAHHYLIHASDFPPLAPAALEIARAYGRLAPDVPHALHMPTHIYTRVGLWEESIDGNARSADAAEARVPRLGGVTTDFHHALDYLAYAHLQRAEDESARTVMDRATAADGPWAAVNMPAIAYALAAIPARMALERRAWAEAAALEARMPAGFPWGERFSAFEAITWFAKALGAARGGELEVARAAIDSLRTLEARVSATSSDTYWRGQVETQRLAAEAWLAFESGDRDEGLLKMRSAAELEAGTEKSPVTPSEVVPAAELLGEMLLLAERPEEALASYEAALRRSPARFQGLAGAARAAIAAGRPAAAAGYYRELLELTADAQVERPEMAAARAYLRTAGGTGAG